MNYRIPHTVFILISVLLRGAVSLSSSFDGRNKNLTEIPTLDDLPATITSLDFSYNNIEVVHPITPQYPPSIKEVILSHNKIDTIVRGAFDNLINLENLDLSYNKITGSSLHIETFKYEIGHFEKIRRLHLRGNHLGNLERLTFTAFGFSTLEYLDLSQCFLQTLEHMSIDNLASLKQLNLSYNSLKTFEQLSLEGLMELEILDLSYNKITVLSEMSSLLSLKALNLDNNGMFAIKENIFSKLLGLKILSLKENNLKTLSPHILPLDSISIKEIRLDKNPWHCDCNLRWLTEDSNDQFDFNNFTLECSFPSRLRGKNIFDISSSELTCFSEMSRFIYILILFFSTCFMLAGIGGLIYFKRKQCLTCHKKGKYIAVFTNDNTNEDGDIQITTGDAESLVRNEETTATEDKIVQYNDD